ncbi:MAG: hypothetical protein O7D30_03415 [Rickettsia endosymbiont of Ixodes persulcatus]|nr:hypothetical protein [Rickettsia endosymbiont of Ixodes persulcatus]
MIAKLYFKVLFARKEQLWNMIFSRMHDLKYIPTPFLVATFILQELPFYGKPMVLNASLRTHFSALERVRGWIHKGILIKRAASNVIRHGCLE